jgi:hypothetical protein
MAMCEGDHAAMRDGAWHLTTWRCVMVHALRCNLPSCCRAWPLHSSSVTSYFITHPTIGLTDYNPEECAKVACVSTSSPLQRWAVAAEKRSVAATLEIGSMTRLVHFFILFLGRMC